MTQSKGRLVDLDDLHLVGAHEIRLLLGGVSRQRVYQITQSNRHFPQPIAALESGKVWLRDDVEDWIAEHRPHQTAAADVAL